MPVDPGIPLRPQLEKLEEKIEKSLGEVCAAPPVKSVDTGELIKIEETLAIAAMAAKEAVSVRRRMRQDGDLAHPTEPPPPASPPPSQPQPGA